MWKKAVTLLHSAPLGKKQKQRSAAVLAPSATNNNTLAALQLHRIALHLLVRLANQHLCRLIMASLLLACFDCRRQPQAESWRGGRTWKRVGDEHLCLWSTMICDSHLEGSLSA